MSLKAKSEKESLESYKEIKEIYELFKKLHEKLGIPERTIFNTEVTMAEAHGSEFIKILKKVRKEKEKRL